jgi:pimeloyl-ACP methyl ester carboxylesterase
MLERQDASMKLPDGRTLGWAQYGAINGKPLLYFHGGVSSRLDIEFADNHCHKKGIRIIAPDRPGIGISSPQPEAQLARLDHRCRTIYSITSTLNHCHC